MNSLKHKLSYVPAFNPSLLLPLELPYVFSTALFSASTLSCPQLIMQDSCPSADFGNFWSKHLEPLEGKGSIWGGKGKILASRLKIKHQ